MLHIRLSFQKLSIAYSIAHLADIGIRKQIVRLCDKLYTIICVVCNKVPSHWNLNDRETLCSGSEHERRRHRVLPKYSGNMLIVSQFLVALRPFLQSTMPSLAAAWLLLPLLLSQLAAILPLFVRRNCRRASCASLNMRWIAPLPLPLTFVLQRHCLSNDWPQSYLPYYILAKCS